MYHTASEVSSPVTNDASDAIETEYTLSNEFDLTDELQQELEEKYPDVLKLIDSLRRLIDKQQSKVRKLKLKLKNQKRETRDVEVQTDNLDGYSDPPKKLSDEIKEAAEMAMQNTGFVYEKTSGLYYDYNSGYYYNAELGLYYDGNTGTYMTYNSETQSYDFHSQVEVVPNAMHETAEDHSMEKKRSKRKNKDKDSAKGCKRDRPADDCGTASDLEEGECSDSSHYDGASEDNSDETYSAQADIAKGWPPCMRIIVKSTEVTKLKEGTLFIITYEGGSLGREGSHAILISDINISKHHLKFTFNKENSQYFVTDLGSRNGTLLNGKRLSAAKQESDPCEVAHGSQLQVGSTVLLCHIHSGNETCGHCEPGLLQTNQDTKENSVKLNKNEQHKNELRNLRKKFGISSYDGNAQLAAGYTDRAQTRRQTVGSQNDHEKTQVASIDQSIGSENKGFKLLSKMGWSEGQSLGKEGTGVLKPVELTSAVGTAGIGYVGPEAPVTTQSTISKQKSNIWEQAQKRYEKLPSSPSLIFDDVD